MAEARHTKYAGQAVSMAEIFNLGFAAKKVEGPPLYTVELSAPEGESTAGGKQALQHIKLVPEGGGATILIGTLNMVDQTAELRTFRHVDELHRQRFKGAPFAGKALHYQTLIDAIHAFLVERKYTITTLERVPTIPIPVTIAAVPAAGVANLHSGSPLRAVLTVTITAAVVIATAMILKR